MPWSPDDAPRHNKKATGAKAPVWAKVANGALKRGLTEGSAIREANAAVDRMGVKTRKPPGR
jgi:hypothetical protein